MRTSLISALLIGCAVLAVVPTLTLAQPHRGRGGGWGPGDANGRLYDASTVEKVEGQVAEVRKVTPLRGMSEGVELVVKTSADEVTVHLGPAWFLDNQDTNITKGDTVQIEGSRVVVQGRRVVLAASVRKNDETLQLRDAAGVPVWAGWRRGR